MGWRLVRTIFVDNKPHPIVYGPGRFDWGPSMGSWKFAHSEPTDDDTIPLGIAVAVGMSGLNAAVNEVRVRSGMPPLY